MYMVLNRLYLKMELKSSITTKEMLLTIRSLEFLIIRLMVKWNLTMRKMEFMDFMKSEA